MTHFKAKQSVTRSLEKSLLCAEAPTRQRVRNFGDDDSESQVKHSVRANLYSNDADFSTPVTADEFMEAIRKNEFTKSKLYRGIEAAELDYLAKNGFLKSKKLGTLDVEAIKNNRVIAAKFPQTSETSTYSAFSSVDNDNTQSSLARQEENAKNSKKS